MARMSPKALVETRLAWLLISSGLLHNLRGHGEGFRNVLCCEEMVRRDEADVRLLRHV